MTGGDLALVLSVGLIASFFGACSKNRVSPKQAIVDLYHWARVLTILNRKQREAYIKDLDSKS